jgi:hypothetical protein
MAGYDPQKSHTRRKVGTDEPAAVDALLGPTVDPEPVVEPAPPVAEVPAVASEAEVVVDPAPEPVVEPAPFAPAAGKAHDVSVPTGRSAGRLVAATVAALAVILLLVAWLRRRAD